MEKTKKISPVKGVLQCSQLLLGKGGQGEIFFAKDKEGNRFAVKKFIKNNLNDDKGIKKMKEHQEKLKELDHPNIVKLYDFTVEKKKGKSEIMA